MYIILYFKYSLEIEQGPLQVRMERNPCVQWSLQMLLVGLHSREATGSRSFDRAKTQSE